MQPMKGKRLVVIQPQAGHARAAADQARRRPEREIDPVCGMRVTRRDGRRVVRVSRHDLLLLRAVVPGQRFKAAPTGALPSGHRTSCCDSRREPRGTSADPARNTSARWIPRFGRPARAPVRSAAWRWSRSTPVAPTTHDDVDLPDASGDRARRARAPARSAAWRSSRASSRVEERNPELDDMTRRFWVSAAADRADPRCSWCPRCCPAIRSARLIPATALRNWIELALATPVVLWGGWPFFERGWASIVNRNLNMFTLIALGVGRRLRLQRGRHARAGICSRTRSAMHGEVAVYFEAAAVIVVLVLLGQVLELRARSRTERGDPRAARPGAADGAPDRCDRPRARRAARTGRGRRSAARAARRERAGRRRGARGRRARRRVDGDRRADAGRERRPGARVIGGTDQRHRRVRDAGRARRRRHAARADRRGWSARRSERGRRFSGSPTGSRLVRAGGHRRRRGRRSSCGPSIGPEPRLALRAGERRRRADHRLPVRARPRDADVDHGRHGPRRRSRAS